MTASGPSRHFGAAQLLGRFRSEADINSGEGTETGIIFGFETKSAKRTRTALAARCNRCLA